MSVVQMDSRSQPRKIDASPIDGSNLDHLFSLDSPGAGVLVLTLRGYGVKDDTALSQLEASLGDLGEYLKLHGAPSHLIVDISDLKRFPEEILGDLYLIREKLGNSSQIHLAGGSTESNERMRITRANEQFSIETDLASAIKSIGLNESGEISPKIFDLEILLQEKIDQRLQENRESEFRKTQAARACVDLNVPALFDGPPAVSLPHGDCTVIRITRQRLDDQSDELAAVAAIIKDAAQTGPVVINLSGVERLGSKVLGDIFRAHTHAPITLCGLSDSVREDLHLKRVHLIIPDLMTEEAATLVASGRGFARDFEIPEGVKNIKRFCDEVLHKGMKSIITDALKVAENKLKGIDSMSDAVKKDHLYALRSAMEELIANALLHGMLELDSGQSRRTNMYNPEQEPDPEIETIVNAKLSNRGSTPFRGYVSVQIEDNNLVLKLSNGRYWDDFKARWDELADPNAPVDIEKLGGRGLRTVRLYFPEGEQSPDGTLTFKRPIS